MYRISLAALTMLLMTGCQCCSWSDAYYDHIDDFSSDHDLCYSCVDRFYDATLDLNRIGKPDWCRSKINRKLCGRTCSCGKCRGR
jgi:hypothetical protein